MRCVSTTDAFGSGIRADVSRFQALGVTVIIGHDVLMLKESACCGVGGVFFIISMNRRIRKAAQAYCFPSYAEKCSLTRCNICAAPLLDR